MLYENIERLSALPGVSGREEAVRAALLELTAAATAGLTLWAICSLLSAAQRSRQTA